LREVDPLVGVEIAADLHDHLADDREVGEPQAVGPLDGEVALDETWREQMLLRPRRRAFPPLRPDRDESVLAHQPRDRFSPTRTPRASRSSACACGDPYVSSLRSKTVQIV
jgi:hypothetical protein